MDTVAAITEQNTAATEQMSAGSSQVKVSVKDVARSSREIASAAEEVSATMEELTTSSEEVADSAERLKETIDDLNATVSKFKLAKITRRCWERKGCAAEIRARCPAYRSEEERCWLIEGTWCGGVQQGDARAKRRGCMRCHLGNSHINQESGFFHRPRQVFGVGHGQLFFQVNNADAV